MFDNSFEGGADDGFIEMATEGFVGVITECNMEMEVRFVVQKGDVANEWGDFMIADNGL